MFYDVKDNYINSHDFWIDDVYEEICGDYTFTYNRCSEQYGMFYYFLTPIHYKLCQS